MNYFNPISSPQGQPSETRRQPVASDSVFPIRSSWPQYAADEIDAATAVLTSGRVNSLAHGDECRAFEREFAAFCDVPHAIAVANGTLGLELALRALGVGEGDEVVVTPRSFVASASCIANCGARPVFADVDPDTQNICPESVRMVVTAKTRAIIAVHLAGLPCDMDGLCAVAKEFGLYVIEDCAQAHGAKYKGSRVGSIGDAGVFSFCTDKIMSTGGEGGMAVFRDADVWARAWSYKDHGKDFQLFHQQTSDRKFRYIVSSIGSNFRMTEMQAAIGRRQLRKLPQWLAARQERAAILQAALKDLPAVRTISTPAGSTHAFYKFFAFIRPEALKADWDRDRILAEANALGAPVQSGGCSEIYREKAFEAFVGPNQPTLPNARMLGETSILAPVDPTLSQSDVAAIGRILRAVIISASNG